MPRRSRKRQDASSTPMQRFEEALGKIVKVSKKDLDAALEKAKMEVEEIEESIRPSDAEAD